MLKNKLYNLQITLRLKKTKYIKRKLNTEDLEDNQIDLIERLKQEFDLIDEIQIKVIETKEDFIFESLLPFFKESRITIANKQILGDALKEYFMNHPEKSLDNLGGK